MAIVIAEFCQNHNGDAQVLREMIHIAKEAGADYAKIQTIFAQDLTFRPEFEETTYDKEGNQVSLKRPYRLEYERLKKLELSYELHSSFIAECRKTGIMPLTTVFSRKRIADLLKLGFSSIKIASYDCGSFPFIEDARDKFSPIFISTGATLPEEIQHAASLLKGRDYYFLHCVTIYPTPLPALNLRKLEYLRKFTPKVGFSDHTLAEKDGLKASLVALALGADVIERHFTILERSKTKDGPISVDREQLKQLCRFAKIGRDEVAKFTKEHIREFKDIAESELKLNLTAQELLNRKYYRGRFASRSDGKFAYNWEEAIL